VPAYGFERIADPPPLEVNTLRLLAEFDAGLLTLAPTWRRMLASATAETVIELARDAGQIVDAARDRLGISGVAGGPGGPSTVEMAEAVSAFHFPDDVWARVIYDLVATARRGDPPVDELVAALVPIYFGRVGSLVVDTRHLTTEQAEERVERQAREFELLKPYLVERWQAEGAGA
jgi:hypothetical protein